MAPPEGGYEVGVTEAEQLVDPVSMVVEVTSQAGQQPRPA